MKLTAEVVITFVMPNELQVGELPLFQACALLKCNFCTFRSRVEGNQAQYGHINMRTLLRLTNHPSFIK